MSDFLKSCDVKLDTWYTDYMWHLRHWSYCWQLRTTLSRITLWSLTINSDNLCYLTINCDTGQHSQFLRCLIHSFDFWFIVLIFDSQLWWWEVLYRADFSAICSSFNKTERKYKIEATHSFQSTMSGNANAILWTFFQSFLFYFVEKEQVFWTETDREKKVLNCHR